MGQFTQSERQCILALSEILIAQVGLRREMGSYWAVDISGLYRLRQDSKPAEKIRAEIAKADLRPADDSRLLPPLCQEPAPLHGYLFSSLLPIAGSRNMALANPQLGNSDCRYYFVLTLGGTMFFKAKLDSSLPQTDEEFLSTGWSQVEGDWTT
jgi:hypothetical protein